MLAVLFATSMPGASDATSSALDGIDPDTICFAAFAAEANDKEKAGTPSSLIESAAGYFLGLMAAHARDSGAALVTDMTRINRQPESSLQPEKLVCMARYMKSLMGIQDALKQISSATK